MDMRKKRRAVSLIGMILLVFLTRYTTVCAEQTEQETSQILSASVMEDIKRLAGCVAEMGVEIHNEAALTELKEMLENKSFGNITFHKDEKAIVYYEGSISAVTFKGDRILVYKETIDKDILLECVLGVDGESGDIYMLGEEWELVKAGVFQDLCLLAGPRPRAVWQIENGINDEVLSVQMHKVADYLKAQGVLGENKIRYVGISSFLGRRYYGFNLVGDLNDDMIYTIKRYDIDMGNGDLYEESDHIAEGTRKELYYLGNINNL